MAKQAGTEGDVRVVATHPLTDKLPNSLEVNVKAAAGGKHLCVINDGYWGIPVKPRTTYHASFYVRGDKVTEKRKTQKPEGMPFSGPLGVSLENADGSIVYARADSPAVNEHWQQCVEPGPLLEPYVQDARDEIEFLTSDAKTTYWGGQRAKCGHPEPFKLTYVEIGNEDYFDRSGNYDARHTQFHDAIKARYPKLQLIATSRLRQRAAMSRWGGAFARRGRSPPFPSERHTCPSPESQAGRMGKGEASVAVARTAAGDSRDVAGHRLPPASGRPGTCEEDARCTTQPVPGFVAGRAVVAAGSTAGRRGSA